MGILAAPHGILTVFIQLQVIAVVLCLHHGIVYLRTGNIQPRHGVEVLRPGFRQLCLPVHRGDNLILSNTFRMGVVGMSKTMAREFGPYNIMVNTMGPGRIYTDRIKYLNTIRAEKAGITLEEYNTRDAASFPQKRYQTADEYARSVVFICSPANSAISGQVICVDGAMTTAY